MGEQNSSIENSIGRRVARHLRALRGQRGLTLRALAERSGVSASMISEAERGTKSPTIAVLSALAEALEVPLSRLVAEGASGASIQVIRAAERRRLLDPSGVVRETLAPTTESHALEFVRFMLPVGTDGGDFAPHRAGTAERIYVERGRVEVRSGEERVVLEAGDSVFFFADRLHGTRNVGDVEAVLYLVIDPPR